MFVKAFKATLGIVCALVLGLVVLAAIGGALGSRAIPSGPTTAPIGEDQAAAAGDKTWVPIKVWTGSGIKDTEKFTVGSEWRVDWHFVPKPSGGIFQIYIYDDANQLVGVAANTQSSDPDASYQHKAGTFYLKINAANGNWTVDIEDMR